MSDSQWIKCSERLPPKEVKEYVVFIVTPSTPDQGFFKGSAEKKEIKIAKWTFFDRPIKEDEDHITIRKEWAFKDLCFDHSIKNITHWLEVKEPNE